MLSDLEIHLQSLLNQVKSLRSTANASQTTFISKTSFRSKAESASKLWFNSVKSALINSVDKEILSKYDTAFTKLLSLSAGNNRKSSYTTILETLTKNFKNELLIPVKTNTVKQQDSLYDDLLKKITDNHENDYLKESMSCLEHDFKRAAVILAWCACIDRIHKKIEEIGFDKFNRTSTNLKNKISGRFKRFTKEFKINSISELREVFDNDILWIIEGMELIDSNQHTRLKGCFDMRCHAAHPGDAPVTKFNLLSSYSDIIEIVLANDKFKLSI